MKLKAIYHPKGSAREYAVVSPEGVSMEKGYALNLAVGCPHNCAYCYAPGHMRMSREDFHVPPVLRKDIFKKLESDLIKLRDEGVKERVFLSFVTDPYCTEEMAVATRRALEMFVAYGISFNVLTKAAPAPQKDFDLYREGDAFGVTLTARDDDLVQKFEPEAALPLSRIWNLQAAKKAGISTWVSFEPVLDAREVKRMLLATRHFVDLYKIGKASGRALEMSTVEDWGAFGRRMESLCRQYGIPYYLKEDLRKEMGGRR